MSWDERKKPVEVISPHFRERWTERCGAAPSVDGLNRIIAEATHIRSQRTLYIMRNGAHPEPYTLLDEYWHHKIGIIIRVDRRNRKAVTVLYPGEGVRE